MRGVRWKMRETILDLHPEDAYRAHYANVQKDY